MTEHAGGLTSQRILSQLNKARFATVAASRASRRIGDLQWRPAQAGSIALDPQRATWNTGHVHDVISDGNVVIAGGQTGGAWLVTPVVGPSFRDGYRATPLSDRWDTPNVYSLAYGPDGTSHVFAGCGEADSLFLIELQPVLGGMVVKQSDLRIPLPGRLSVYQIAALDQPRRLVIGTSDGVFWADVPPSPIDVSGYAWMAATGMPPGGCAAIARGPGQSLAAAWSPPAPLIAAVIPTGPTVPDRLFVGDWQEDSLVFAPATVPEIAQTQASGFVLASCATARHRIYGAAMDDDAFIRCVLRSDDGGHNWRPVAIPANAGDQGYHNRAIAVSPYRPDVVAIGWIGGPFLSTDGGSQWTLLTGGSGLGVDGLPCHGLAKALHSDIQALHFPVNSLQADHLIVASDGGLIATRDLGHCFDSEYSRPLAVLQFYGAGHLKSDGTLAVSSRFPGLLAGGTQDNGNVTLHPDRDAGPVWHRLVGGDGGLTRFVDPLGVLLHVNNGELRVRMATWDAAAGRFDGAGTVVPKDGADGLVPRGLEPVVAPAWRRDSQLMYAVAGSENGDVHGLFADSDAQHASFLRLGNVGHAVSALASLTGAQVLVGRTDGQIRLLDAMSGLSSELSLDDSVSSGGVSRFEILSPQVAYALKTGQLLRFDGQTWRALPGPGDWATFTMEPETGRLFASTASDVFSSTDGGQSWTDASVGLPMTPHITDMRTGADEDGGRTLYLTTYGRSAWRATITLPPRDDNPLELPPQALAILRRLIEERGALVRDGETFIALEGREPAADILGGLLIDQIARHMSAESSREIRIAALRGIERAAARAIAGIG